MRTCLIQLLICLALPGTSSGEISIEYWAENEPQQVRATNVPTASMPTASDPTALPLVTTQPAEMRTTGSVYRLDREGLYRVREFGSTKVIHQSILYRGDVWRFAGHLSRLYVYGTRHADKTQAQWDELARSGEPLSVQCGHIAAFVHQHLAAVGVQSRLVCCVTVRDWNRFDDGHVLMEVFDPKEDRYLLFDPTLGIRLRHNERYLDLLEAAQLYRKRQRADTIEFIRAGSKLDPLMDYGAFVAKGFADAAQRAKQLRSFTAVLRGDVESIHQWYGRIMNIPRIDEFFVVDSEGQEARVRTLPGWAGFKRLSESDFRRQFYSQSKPAACSVPSQERPASSAP